MFVFNPTVLTFSLHRIDDPEPKFMDDDDYYDDILDELSGFKFEGFIRGCDNEFMSLGVDTKSRVIKVHYLVRNFECCLTHENIFSKSDKFLVDSTLTLVIKLTFFRDTKELDVKKDQPKNGFLMSEVENAFNEKSYSDFIFICSDGVTIPAHRLICSAYSPVLKAMFNSDMIEAKECAVKLDDIDSEAMNEILRFLYTKKVNYIGVLAPKLLYGAEKYELDELKELCAESMMKNLSVHNVLKYFILADQYNLKELMDHCSLLIELNYKTVREQSKEWEKLNERYLTMLLDYFNDSITKKAIDVFESTL